jgi:hypothetical protein
MGERFKARLTLCVSACLLTFTATAAIADQTGLGPWNNEAEKLARSSALATTSLAFLKEEISKIGDPAVRRETEDAVFNPDTCLKSRAGLTAERKRQIVETLGAEGLVDANEAGRIPGGLLAGVFPGVRDDGTGCPKLPMLYVASPGSGFGGHHSQPGGLAMHVAVNLTSAVHLAATYRKVYGTLDAKGLPVVRSGAGQSADGDVFIDEDIAIGAPPRFILAALWMELAVVAGTVLGWALAAVAAVVLGRAAGLSVTVVLGWPEALLAAAILVGGLVAAALPALIGGRTAPGASLKL